MRRRLYDTIQVWGPGAVALVSLLASISYGLGQERKIGRLEGRVYSLEIYQVEIRPLQEKIQQLEVDLKEAKDDAAFEAAKSQNMRERLIKKGWIE